MTKNRKSDIQHQIAEAYDFDPNDPLFGLSRQQISGPILSRRSVLRLMAAAGTLTASQLLPGVGTFEARAASGGTLNCGWSGVGQITTLDPAQINQVLQFQISSNVLSGLTHISADLIAQGDLAENWTVSDDGTRYLFKLREGVTFHNGDKFTADDVLFTYNRSKDAKQSIHSRVLKNVMSVEKVSDYEVRFNLAKPQASFLTKTLERSSGRAMTIVCQGALASMGSQKYGLAPVGTGPFKIVKHELGQGLTMEKFANYYDPARPKLDKVTIIPIIDAEPLAAALEAGDIQLIGGNPIAPELIDRFVANNDLIVDEIAAPGFQTVFMNPWRDPMKVTDFNKPLSELLKEKGFMVRMAIAKALDRDRYLKIARFGRGRPAFGTINPAMGFYYDTALNDSSAQRYDLAAAKKLLADAGFPDGKDFPELKLLTTPSNRRESLVVANILSRNLGIKVEVETKDFPVLIEDFNSMNFDICRLGSGGDFDPDDALVDWGQTNSKFNGRNRDKSKMPFGFFSDNEVDSLIDAQSVEADPAKRKIMVQKANKISSDKVATAFLFHPADILVHHKSVNFPKESRIPGLVDLDRVTLS